MSYQLIVQFKIKPEQVSAFVDIMQGAKERIAAAEGCGGVEVMVSKDAPNKVVLSEKWDSMELHDVYAAKMRESGAMDQLAAFMEGAPESEVFEIR